MRTVHSRWVALLSVGFCWVATVAAEEHPMARYNVVWNRPSQNATGQMPLGNGDIAAGVYAIEDGDLYLLLSKNDAYNYNGDIFKTGRVRISLSPNPFAQGKPFQQTLDLPTGSIRISAAGVKLLIWADANRNVYHVQIDSPTEVSVTAVTESWQRFDTCSYNASAAPAAFPTQDVRVDRDDQIISYYAVGDRSVFRGEMAYYDVPEMIDRHPDPYRFNTFGNLLESPNLKLADKMLRGKGRSLDIRIHALCKQEPDITRWMKTLKRQVAKPIDLPHDWERHCRWWSDFWKRSWIIASDNRVSEEERGKLSGEGYKRTRNESDTGALVAQSYNVFRFLMACQSRGKVQTKFNGGLFTQPLLYQSKQQLGRGMHAREQPDGTWFSHEDEREWGRRFTYQNQRLLYWPLLMSGDFEMMHPFFRYYRGLLPVRKAITKAWFGHQGAYYRENIEPTGGERDCGRDGKPPRVKPGENRGQGYYHSFYFTSGLETLAMMIDYVKHTGDAKFCDNIMVPFAREVLLFFDKHYPREADGTLRIDPNMALETWWVAVNSAPDVAGLTFCLDQLLSMDAGTPTDRTRWEEFREQIPPIHLREINGRQAIAPAREWSHKHNAENAELYPVFPFRCLGLGRGTQDLVDWTMRHRTNKNAFGGKCWTQDQIHWAYAGNASEACRGLIRRFRHASPQCRFPLYGSRGPDSCPDFDHFGAGSVALQRMLVQQADGKIHLLPAWPEIWDANFQLHVQQKGVISGRVVDGELVDWTIHPTSRTNDVIVHQPQELTAHVTETGPATAAIPKNNLDLRIGLDRSGGSRFRGRIARATIFPDTLSSEEIGELAETARDKKLTGAQVATCVLSPQTGDVLSFDKEALGETVSFEAWIRPVGDESGRIFDKLSVGQRDGFLIDCWPGNSIRVIVGPAEKVFHDVLTPDRWQHVFVSIGPDHLDAFLNGKRLGE